jgi:nitrate reductase gamma subunit
MVFALVRLVAIHLLAMRSVLNNTQNKDIAMGALAKSITDWILPMHLLKTRPLFSVTSFLWHLCIILLPLLFVSHILLWERGLASFIPGITSVNIPDFIELNKHAADLLTLITVLCTALLFVLRAVNPVSRALSEPMDYILLGLIAAPFITGFLAVHPAMSPIPYNVTMLLHILSAEAIFVLMPFTKLAHVALFPFGRISSDIYWRFPEGAGHKIAGEMHGEEAKV